MTDYKNNFSVEQRNTWGSTVTPVMEEKTKPAAKEVIIEEKPKVQKGTTTVKLRIRKVPNGEIVRVVSKDTMLEFTEIKDGWAHLTDGNYCMVKFLDI